MFRYAHMCRWRDDRQPLKDLCFSWKRRKVLPTVLLLKNWEGNYAKRNGFNQN